MTISDDVPDGLALLINAGLDAAGVGFLAPIWQSFIPSGDPVFSDAEIAQLTEVFAQVLGASVYSQWLANFRATSTSMNEYINNPLGHDDLLTYVQENSLLCAEEFKAIGPPAAQMYLAAMTLHIVALKAVWELAPADSKDGAAKNIAAGVEDTLSSLLYLELALQPTVTLDVFCNFKCYTSTNEIPIPDSLAASFGSRYRDNVLSLIGLLAYWDSSLLSNLQSPSIVIWFRPADPSFINQIWDSSQSHNGAFPLNAIFYNVTCPWSVNGYMAIGDLCTISEYSASHEVSDLPFSSVPFIKNTPGSAFLSEFNGSPDRPWIDNGSGNPNAYSGWCVYNSGGYRSIATYNGIGDGTQPPTSGMAVMQNLPFGALPSMPDTSFSRDYDYGGNLFRHPQFGAYGLYTLLPGASSETTAPTVDLSMILGHPYFPDGSGKFAAPMKKRGA